MTKAEQETVLRNLNAYITKPENAQKMLNALSALTSMTNSADERCSVGIYRDIAQTYGRAFAKLCIDLDGWSDGAKAAELGIPANAAPGLFQALKGTMADGVVSSTGCTPGAINRAVGVTGEVRKGLNKIFTEYSESDDVDRKSNTKVETWHDTLNASLEEVADLSAELADAKAQSQELDCSDAFRKHGLLKLNLGRNINNIWELENSEFQKEMVQRLAYCAAHGEIDKWVQQMADLKIAPQRSVIQACASKAVLDAAIDTGLGKPSKKETDAIVNSITPGGKPTPLTSSVAEYSHKKLKQSVVEDQEKVSKRRRADKAEILHVSAPTHNGSWEQFLNKVWMAKHAGKPVDPKSTIQVIEDLALSPKEVKYLFAKYHGLLNASKLPTRWSVDFRTRTNVNKLTTDTIIPEAVSVSKVDNFDLLMKSILGDAKEYARELEAQEGNGTTGTGSGTGSDADYANFQSPPLAAGA